MSLNSSEILVYGFLLISLWYRDNAVLIKLVGKCFNLFNLEKSLLRLVLFILKYLVEITNLTYKYRAIHLSIFS